MAENKLSKKLEFFIIPLIFLVAVTAIIFFEIIRSSQTAKLKIKNLNNLTNEEKTSVRDGYEALLQIRLMRKELAGLEKKAAKENLDKISELKKRIGFYEQGLILTEKVEEIKKISQDFWDAKIWQEIGNLDSERK